MLTRRFLDPYWGITHTVWSRLNGDDHFVRQNNIPAPSNRFARAFSDDLRRLLLSPRGFVVKDYHALSRARGAFRTHHGITPDMKTEVPGVELVFEISFAPPNALAQLQARLTVARGACYRKVLVYCNVRYAAPRDTGR
jgi:hypothetical protein